MHTVASRAAGWSREIVVASLAALGACSDDDPVAPKMPRTPNAAVRGADAVEITVTNTSGVVRTQRPAP